ncbi:M20/M25/M40 family metallo-hydrolase [Spirillospora sp. NPDC050679]
MPVPAYRPLAVVQLPPAPGPGVLDDLAALAGRGRVLAAGCPASAAEALRARGLAVLTGQDARTLGVLLDHADVVTAEAKTAADVLALARDLAADHVRLAPGAGDADLSDLAADVVVCAEDTLSPLAGTRLWRTTAPSPDLELLSRSVQISSVSGDERDLAEFLAAWCAEQGLDATVDEAGNLVATRGTGPRRLLLLGHLDTVPHRWPARWHGEVLTGRGSVDAKASLAAYLQTLAELEVPANAQVRVVGAVQEETTSSGAFHVRDRYPADAVVVGEPSGAHALTVGYHGLCKIRLAVREPTAHTAGRGVRTAADRLVDAAASVRSAVSELSPDALVAVLGVEARNRGDVQAGEAVIDVRVPPRTATADLRAAVRAAVEAPVTAGFQRCTPGVATPRSDALVRAFTRALRAAGSTPRHLAKKGSSDMNTLATTWTGVPMVAYGPGDARLDHTPHERLDAAEYRHARTVLAAAVRDWLSSSA